MTIRDRAYNVIKTLKKAWFAEYCDVQAEIEKAMTELELETVAPLQDRIDEMEEALRDVARDNSEGFCLLCGMYPCMADCSVGKALKGK